MVSVYTKRSTDLDPNFIKDIIIDFNVLFHIYLLKSVKFEKQEKPDMDDFAFLVDASAKNASLCSVDTTLLHNGKMIKEHKLSSTKKT